MIVPDTKIYNGFCRSSTDALSDPSSRVSDLLHNDSKFEVWSKMFVNSVVLFRLESTNSVVNSLCKNNNAEVIKVLIAKDTTDLSDESFVSILSFIARLLYIIIKN